MMRQIYIIPNELQLKIEEFEIRFEGAQVSLFESKVLTDTDFYVRFQNRNEKLDALWAIEGPIRRESNYQTKCFNQGSRIIQRCRQMVLGKYLTVVCHS